MIRASDLRPLRGALIAHLSHILMIPDAPGAPASVAAREAELGDLPAVADRIAAQSPGTRERWLKRMQWQTVGNPWSRGRVNGIVLVDDGRIVGHYFVIPQPVWSAGATGTAVFGLDLFISAPYRGGFTSMNLIRAAHRLGQPVVVATSSANPISEAIWHRLGAKPLADGAVSLARPLRWLRVLVAAAARAIPGGALTMSSAPRESEPLPSLPSSPGAGWTARIASDFSEAARLWSEVRPRFAIATDRSEEYLAWRYGPDSPGGQLVLISDPEGRIRAWYACRVSSRGTRVRARLVRVLDVVAAPDDAPAIDRCIHDLVTRARAARADLIEARGMAQPFRARFEANGFRPRMLPANPFLLLPGARPLPEGGIQHLVAADGDAGFD